MFFALVFNTVCVHMCVFVCARAQVTVCVHTHTMYLDMLVPQGKCGNQETTYESLLFPHITQVRGGNLGHHTCQQVPLRTEEFSWPWFCVLEIGSQVT